MTIKNSSPFRQARLLLLSLCPLLFIQPEIRKPVSPAPPNIIVILVDDAGYADFGFMGSKDLRTPHIDELAGRSIRFSDAHVSSSVCSPSRAGLLTGKYQQRYGYECNEGDGYSGLDSAARILPAWLKQAGYNTAAFGKWHLGFEPYQHPLKKGFDYYYGFLSGGRSYFYRPDKDDRPGSRNALLENNNPTRFDGYLTDVLGDKAADYIKTHKDKPFFMYWAPNAVHTPMEAAEADMKSFEGHPRQKLAAMTFALDRAIGKILQSLKEEGLTDNTLIFFLSDNGGAHNNQSRNTPLKGFKGNEYEAGHRVPFLLSWPARFKNGGPFSGLSSSLDIAATAFAAAGITPGRDSGSDGVNLLPFMEGTRSGNPHTELVWRKDGAAALRFNQYKLIRIKGIGERLYDLNKDPGETTDLLQTNPKWRRKLNKQLEQWEKDKKAPRWTEGAQWDTITLMIHDDLMHNRPIRVADPGELQQYRNQQQRN